MGSLDGHGEHFGLIHGVEATILTAIVATVIAVAGGAQVTVDWFGVAQGIGGVDSIHL